jgi:hypothetical protein
MEYGLNEHKTFNFNNACCGGGTFMGVDGQESSEQIADETANAEVIKPTTVSGNFLTKSVMLNIPVWMLLVGVGVIGYKMFYKKA